LTRYASRTLEALTAFKTARALAHAGASTPAVPDADAQREPPTPIRNHQ
jgi:hypothetical protein